MHSSGLGCESREVNNILNIVLPVVELKPAANLEEDEARELVDMKITTNFRQVLAVNLGQPLSRDEGGDLLVKQTVSSLSHRELYQPGGTDILL